MSSYCIVIPAYNSGPVIESVIEKLLTFELPLIVVNDGSTDETTEILAPLETRESLLTVVHRSQNGGKGAAVKDGIRTAFSKGFSHALQVDSDGQHNLDDIPQFIEMSRTNPRSLILGTPVFSDAPIGRLLGRKLSVFCVMVETISTAIKDPLFGFRIYPVEDAHKVIETTRIGDYMDFDPEIAVKLYWSGLSVCNIPSKVSYDTPIASNFRMFTDNVKISIMHTKLLLGALVRLIPLIKRHF